jgi:hypothetical protein
MTYSIVAWAATGMDCAENTILLTLFTARCLVTAGCCTYTILASKTLLSTRTLLEHGHHFDYWNLPLNMCMRAATQSVMKPGLCCYLLIYIESLFYFHLWPTYWHFVVIWFNTDALLVLALACRKTTCTCFEALKRSEQWTLHSSICVCTLYVTQSVIIVFYFAQSIIVLKSMFLSYLLIVWRKLLCLLLYFVSLIVGLN